MEDGESGIVGVDIVDIGRWWLLVGSWVGFPNCISARILASFLPVFSSKHILRRKPCLAGVVPAW